MHRTIKNRTTKKAASFKWIFVLLSLIILIGIQGCGLHASNKDPDKDSITVSTNVEQSPSPTPTPSPTSTPTPTPTPVPKNYSILKSRIEEYISEQPGKYGVSFINLATGDSFDINATDEYIAASTSKLPMNLLLFKKISEGEIDPEMILTYKEEDFEPGSGVIQKEEFGAEYTVLETARLSIKYSDNCAINMIIRLLGIDNIRQYMQDLGGTVYYGGRHRSCPKDMAIYAHELYDFYLDDPEVAGILISNLENTIFNNRINKLLPGDVPVAHKIGNFTRTANDVGIIFASEPYILSMMSEDVDFNAGCNVLAQISKMVYDFIED